VNFTPRPRFTSGKEPSYPLSRRPGGSQKLSGRCEEENLSSLPEFEPQPVQLVASRSIDEGHYLHPLITFLLTTKRLKSFVYSSLYKAVGVPKCITWNDKVIRWLMNEEPEGDCNWTAAPGTCLEWLRNIMKAGHNNWWSGSESRTKPLTRKTTCPLLPPPPPPVAFWIPAPPDHGDFTTSPLKTDFLYSQVPFKTGFSV
jgi:hypothetical protein